MVLLLWLLFLQKKTCASRCSRGLTNWILMSEMARLWLPPAHSPMMSAHSLSWGRMFISSIRRSIVLCSGSTCSSPGSTQFTDAEWEAGRCYSLEFSPRNQTRGGGLRAKAKPVGMLGLNNNALLFIWYYA